MRIRTLYMIRPISENVVKIGLTADLWARFKTLQAATWQRLYIAGVLPWKYGGEAQLHARFSEYLIHGEWFREADRIMQEVFELNEDEPRPYGYNNPLILQTNHSAWENSMRTLLSSLDDI